MLGYLWERFVWVSLAVPTFYIALTAPGTLRSQASVSPLWAHTERPVSLSVLPGYYQHLTYWTLMLHTVYFTVDKESPDAKYAIYLLHGFSFCGAIAVFVGYALI